MFKVIQSIKNDKHGFTLVELLVTLTILLIALTLTGELAGMIYKNYKIVEERWIVQNEVDFIMKSFQRDPGNESLTTANFVDLYYEPTMENVLLPGATGTFSALTNLGEYTINADKTITFVNTDNENIYIFTVNGYMYILNRGSNMARILMLSDEIQVKVSFEVSVSAFELGTTGKELESQTKVDGSNIARKYLQKGITITVESGDIYSSKYSLHTSFSFDNMNQGQKVNILGGSLASPYVAGYTHGELENYPTANDYAPGKSVTDYQYLTEAANVLKFVSTSAYFAQMEQSGNAGASNNFSCTTRYLMAGSKYETPVVNALRDFRNNVLKGTVVGDFIIEKYYDWSPAVIEAASNSKVLKAVLKAFVVPAAAAAFCISE